MKPVKPVTVEMDEDFLVDLRARPESDEWKMRACAGRTVRVVFVEESVEALERARAYGMSRTLNAVERQAWLYGFEWEKGKAPRSIESLRAELERSDP